MTIDPLTNPKPDRAFAGRLPGWRHLLAAVTLPAVAAAPAAEPVRLPAPGGEVIALDPAQHATHVLDWHFAPVRVDGAQVHVSGVVAGVRPGSPVDVAAYEAAVRRAFTQIRRLLAAAGQGRAVHVIEMTSYHVWSAPGAALGKAEQIAAFRRIKDEFVPAPYPAWTAIGVADLIPDGGLVEIRVTARRELP